MYNNFNEFTLISMHSVSLFTVAISYWLWLEWFSLNEEDEIKNAGSKLRIIKILCRSKLILSAFDHT